MTDKLNDDDIKIITEFQAEMMFALKQHYPKYGNTWKEMSKGKLFDRLSYKFKEFEMTFDKDKLISLANLAMLLYIRLDVSESIKRDKLI